MHIYIYIPIHWFNKIKIQTQKKKKEKINLYHLSVHRIRSEVQNEGSSVKSLWSFRSSAATTFPQGGDRKGDVKGWKRGLSAADQLVYTFPRCNDEVSLISLMDEEFWRFDLEKRKKETWWIYPKYSFCDFGGGTARFRWNPAGLFLYFLLEENYVFSVAR